MTQNNIKGVYLSPGLPHILQKTQANSGYQTLADACRQIGEKILAAKVERIVYYSTGWISVLGQMVQTRPDLKGEHVDENWYDFGALDYNFHVDTKFGKALAKNFRASGRKVHEVDYEGFPVDTATIVVDKLINSRALPTLMLANHVYSDYGATRQVAQILNASLAQDSVPTAVVLISLLSGRFFTTAIDLREDRISSAEDDSWNKKMLALLADGKYSHAETLLPEYAKATKADWGFKALAFAQGLFADDGPRQAKLYGYAPLYGAAGAVVEL